MAFDSRPHYKLVDKLWALGKCGRLWHWFQSYLCNRRHCASITGCLSSFLPVLFGVSKGSVLGPLLFLIYVNDLTNAISMHALPLMLANGSKCLNSVYKATDCDIIQANLDAFSVWCTRNCLSFNVCAYTITEVPVFEKNSGKDLGIYSSEDSIWSFHYDY